MLDELGVLGLSSIEAKIYLHVLEKGLITAPRISTNLSLAKTTVYRYLTTLEEKGVVYRQYENSIAKFQALNPQNIKKLISDKLERLNLLIPKLESIQGISQQETHVVSYRGSSGVKTIVNELIEAKSSYIFLGRITPFFQVAEGFSNHALQRFEEFKISGKLLVSKDEVDHITFKTTTYDQFKVVPQSLISEVSYFTFGFKTVLITWGTPIQTIIISDERIAQQQRALFNHLWNIF